MKHISRHPGIQLLEEAFQEFLATGKFTVERYFSPEYEQWSDGARLDYAAFVQHLQALAERKRQGYSFDSFTIHETVVEGDRFVSRHSLSGKDAQGNPFTVFVLALFEVRNGLLARCWELSHMQGGSAADRAFASIRE
ncbi:nuclear transport factor 2 family protein [Ktedonosporobacter rubrisoli]|uniref:Nuclear transport factor 2 family protein n=1 Tax=Ktedonosporobacter rubrisoli TaxID=2509675 RepID=A0A4P6JNZ5_KTERU|nr:nuclear transport factor 2 family protein [Ktedonosporobacter rubrisoli]QBD76965.1 nuclear transport factor 2 family protein [Ktedonosporobacter rubrisoli]